MTPPEPLWFEDPPPPRQERTEEEAPKHPDEPEGERP